MGGLRRGSVLLAAGNWTKTGARSFNQLDRRAKRSCTTAGDLRRSVLGLPLSLRGGACRRWRAPPQICRCRAY